MDNFTKPLQEEEEEKSVFKKKLKDSLIASYITA